MADYTFQERATGGNINIAESAINSLRNSSSFVKFKIGYEGVIPLNSTADYLDSSGNAIIQGKIKIAKEIVKDATSERRIYELAIYDYGYNLIDGNLNEVFRNLTPEEIIEDIVEANGLTFVNQLPSASGLTIIKKVYRDRKPIDAVNELCNTLGANWKVTGTNFYLYRTGDSTSSVQIDDLNEWVNTEGWKDDTDKMANQVIVQGAKITQRTTETLTGTNTVFYTSWIPNDIEIVGFTQTTDTIDGDYSVDTQNKKITFEASQTNPVVSYSYESQVRSVVGTGPIIKVLKKSYIESYAEARKLGRKYLELYEDGISSATFRNVDLFGLDIRELRCGDKIKVINRNNSLRDNFYIISKVIRKYPQNTEVTVGEDESSIYEWQSESKDRIKQLEESDNNAEFSQVDIPNYGTVKVKVTGTITQLREIFNDGKILWASDTPFDNDADLISDDNLGTIFGYGCSYDTGIVGDYCLKLDGSALATQVPAGFPNNSELKKLGNTYQDYSISFWAKGKKPSSYFARIFEETGNYAFAIRHSNSTGKISMSVWDGTNNPGVSENIANGDTWHHYVVSRDTSIGKLRMWKDGVEQTQVTDTTTSGNITNLSNQVNIGNTLSGDTRAWEGSLDEIIIYKRVLTSDEILSLYNKEEIFGDILVKYGFEEGSGTTIYDGGRALAYDDDDLPAGSYVDYV